MKKVFVMLLVTCFCSTLLAQKVIKGNVKDASDGSLLPGVVVQVKGSSNGTLTDVDGFYSITVGERDQELTFSFLGMETKTEKIGNRSVIDVSLSLNSVMMDEVVVSALGIKRDAKSLSFSQQGVDAATMAEVRDQNIVSSLSGKIAGVQIVPPSTAVGSARIVIRGNSSFTGENQPLFVVDGMPIDNGAGDGSVSSTGGGLDYGNGAADINPSDIESMEILKGPNAAALYGSRAANGVVLITTKKGAAGKMRVSLNSNTQFSYISQYPDVQNVFGVGHVFSMVGGDNQVIDPETGLPTMAGLMSRQGSRSYGAPMMGQKYIGLDGKVHEYTPQRNNIKDFYKTAHIITNSLAVEGGTKDHSYRFSYTNVMADDIVDKQNEVLKNTFNMRVFNTLAKGLTLDSKLTYINDKTTNRQYLNGDSKNPVYAYINMPRSMSLDQLSHYKDESGQEYGSGDFRNPFWLINENRNEDNKTRVMGNLELSYEFIKDVKFILRYGKDYAYTKGYEFQNSGAYNNKKGYFRNFHNSMDNNMYEFLLLLNKKLGEDFSLIANFGGNRTDNKYYNAWASIESLKQPGFAHISNSNDPQKTDDRLEKKRINSLYGSVSLGYKGWAYLDVTGRNDWSSTLPKGNNSYFYPSVGATWIPSDMLGIPSSTFFGKLRASYAMVGNDTRPYNLIPYYSFDPNNIFNDYKYASLPELYPNPNLKPERTYSYEIGTDLRFLNGRINFDFTYYYSVSKDQIIEASVSPASGYPRRMYNAGEIENKGIEMSLTAIPVRTKDFEWELSANFSKNNSKVLEMIDGVDRLPLAQCWSSWVYVEKGKPYGIVRGKAWKRDEQGRRLVDDRGKPIKEEDKYLGNANPDWLMGISNRFRYRDFELYVLLDIKKGGGLFSGSRKQGIRSGVFLDDYSASGNPIQDRIDYWERSTIFGDPGGDKLWGGSYFDDIYFESTGEKCNYRYLPQEIGYYADEMDELVYYDASYVKLRELSVSYNVPKKFLSKIKLSGLRLSFVGRNLWIIHQNTPDGLDPEASANSGNGQGLETGSLPPATNLGFDIKITF